MSQEEYFRPNYSQPGDISPISGFSQLDTPKLPLSSTIRREVPNIATHSYLVVDPEISRISERDSKRGEQLQRTVRKLWELKNQMKQEQARVKSSMLTFLNELYQNNSLTLQYMGIEMERLNTINNLKLRRVEFEKEDLQSQLDDLKQQTEKFEKMNEELKTLLNLKSRELDVKERVHKEEIENFQQLCDQMVQNLVDEKNQTPTEPEPRHESEGRKIRDLLNIDNKKVSTVSATSGVDLGDLDPLGIKPAKSHFVIGAIIEETQNVDAEEINFLQEELRRTKEQLEMVEAALRERESALRVEQHYSSELDERNFNQASLIYEQGNELAHLKLRLATIEKNGEEIVKIFKREEEERTKRYEESLSKLEEANATLQELVSNFVEKQHLKEKEAENLKREIEILREELENARKETESVNTMGMFKEGLRFLEEEINTLRQKKIEESDSDKGGDKEQEEKDGETQRELQDLKDYVAALASKLEGEEEKYKEIHQNFEKAVQDEMAFKIQSIEEKMNRYKEKKKEYKSKIVQLREEASNREREKEDLKTKIYEYEESVKTRISELNEKVAKTKEMRDEYKRKLEEAQTEIATKQEEWEKLDRMVIELTDKVTRHAEREEEYKKLLKEAEERSESDKEGQESVQKEIGMLREKLERKREKKRQYKAQLMILKEEVDSERKAKEDLQARVAGLEKSIELLSESEDSYKKISIEVRIELDALKRRSEETATTLLEVETKMFKYQQKKKDYKKRLLEAQKDALTVYEEKEKVALKVSELQREIERSSKSKEELREEDDGINKELEMKVQELEGKIKGLEGKIAQYQEEEERYKITLKENEKDITQERKENERMASVVAELEEKMRKLRDKKKDYKKQLTGSKDEISSKEYEKEEMNVKVQDLEEQLKSAKEIQDDMEKRLAELTEQTESERKAKDSLASKIRDHEEELKKAIHEKESLEKSLTETTHKLNEHMQLLESRRQVNEQIRKHSDMIFTETSIGGERVERKSPDSPNSLKQGEEGGTTRREEEGESGEKVKDMPHKDKVTFTLPTYHTLDESEITNLNAEIQKLAKSLQDVTKERDDYKNKVTEIDLNYQQKIDQMNQELTKKDQHIHALHQDVGQMKMWVYEQQSDVHEKSMSESQEHSLLENLQKENREPASPAIAGLAENKNKELRLDVPKSGLKMVSSPHSKTQERHGSEKKGSKDLGMHWKVRSDDYTVVRIVKQVPSSAKLPNAGHGHTKDKVEVFTPERSKKSESIGTSESRKSKKKDPVYLQLEGMIMELNEKLAKSKADFRRKMEVVNKEAQEREDKLREEIDKMKDEKKALEKKIDDIQWEHAYEMNALINKEKAHAEKTPAQEAAVEKKTGAATENKKKKKKK